MRELAASAADGKDRAKKEGGNRVAGAESVISQTHLSCLAAVPGVEMRHPWTSAASNAWWKLPPDIVGLGNAACAAAKLQPRNASLERSSCFCEK